MARIEKTVFISYRRKDISWALAVYQYLTSQKYDVFFDYTSIPSGDFEQIIVSNIKARAHFVLILTPTALDRCSNPGDWLRREIETAIDEKRNIIPLFFDGFNFGSPSIAEKLTGKLSTINRYNGLDIPSGYFMEGMERLRSRYLNMPLNAVLHPIPTEVRKVVKEEQVAADKAVKQSDDVKEIVKPVEEKVIAKKQDQDDESVLYHLPLNRSRMNRDDKLNLRPYVLGVGIVLIAVLMIAGVNSLIQNIREKENPTSTSTPKSMVETMSLSTQTSDVVAEFTLTSTKTIPTKIATVPSFTPTPELGIGSTMTSDKDGMTLLYVPAGEFKMGSDTGNPDEKPVHTVYLDAFWIDQTEVTNAMFVDFIKDTAYTTDANKAGKSYVYQNNSWQQVNGVDWLHPSGPTSGISDILKYPVVHVSWNDANAYCEWAGRRLPTEAEWEKAARGTDERIYPWGNVIDQKTYANFNNVVGSTTQVGNYKMGKSFYGAYDMAGNVWEWVADRYADAYYQISSISNPLGPGFGQSRVSRGGSWGSRGYNVRSTNRNWNDPTYTHLGVGFRCASSP